MRSRCLALPTAIGLTLLTTLGGAGLAPEPAPPPTVGAHQCAGSIGVPLTVTLDAPVVVGPNATIQIQGQIESSADLAEITMVSTSRGSSRPIGGGKLPPAPSLNGAGSGAPFTLSTTFTGTQPAEVSVKVTATNAADGQVWERNESIAFFYHDGQWMSGMGTVLNLQMKAIENDFQSGKLTEEAARAATKELLTAPAATNQNPINMMPRTAAEQATVDALAKWPVDVPKPLGGPHTTGTCITIEGNVQWNDENGNPHPAFGLNAQIWDEDSIIDEFVDVTATDTNGNYHIEVDGDDGFLQGDRDIYVKIITANSAVSIEPAGIFTSPYHAESGVHDETPCGTTITENFFFDNPDPNPSVNLCEAQTWVAIYVKDTLNGGSFLGQIVCEWPGSTTSANYDGSDINLRPGDRWDWDVCNHEYGHYVQDVFDIENNPGGPHNIGDCVSDVHMSKSEGCRLAFAEGWPTYNATVAQTKQGLSSLNVPRVGDNVYADTGESNFSYSLETQDSNGIGEDNEVAVQRIFWDWYDSASDSRDAVSLTDTFLFNQINPADPTTLSAAWAAIRGGLSNANLLACAEVLSDHFVGPRLSSPAANAIVSPSNNNNLSWTRAVGCGTAYDGDGFTVRFFKASDSSPVSSIAVGNTTSHALTLGELQTLVAASHNILWGVEGSNSSDPATGPYLGETFAITVNRPPVADAGTDIEAECTSSTTTPVQLNGTASSDPDGDALTYTWTATGITFDNNHSATPTGNFPDGTTTVTLSVSDGIESDTDMVDVTIVDTTPPVITCPVAVEVECNDHCSGGGVPKDDDQLTDFFNGVSAVDVCDPDPDFSNNAPDCFPLGTTDVIFTAKDDKMNAASCTTSVTVVDTTPPEITVVLSRDALWPPNHKMAAITASVTVTDLCDPNPTFVLTSITSDEPDNGTGDGDTANDIQGATAGTADTMFALRSERKGNGDGRVYTIIYTASDQSGNTTPDTATVIVPHDRGGMAMNAGGFVPSGLALDPNLQSFRLVIPASPGIEPRLIDGVNAILGNSINAVRPLRHEMRDVNGDGQPDLSLWYDTRATLDLRSQSTRKDPIGLHYWGFQKTGYLVADIFALPRMIIVEHGDGDDNTARVEDGGDLGQPGQTPITSGAMPPIGLGNPGLNSNGTLVVTQSGPAVIEVFDVTGRRIRTILSGDLSSGRHELAWDGRDDRGASVANGLYFYRARTADGQFTRKVYFSR